MAANGKNISGEHRLVGQLVWVSVIACVLAVVLFIGAMTWPIRADESTLDEASRSLAQLIEPQADVTALVRKMAGRRMIRPAQAQAAVKDSGASDRLLAQLKLTGIVDLGGRYVAYIEVGEKGTKEIKSVQSGQKILDFTVEKVEPGSVTLNLEGIVRELRY